MQSTPVLQFQPAQPCPHAAWTPDQVRGDSEVRFEQGGLVFSTASSRPPDRCPGPARPGGPLIRSRAKRRTPVIHNPVRNEDFFQWMRSNPVLRFDPASLDSHAAWTPDHRLGQARGRDAASELKSLPPRIRVRGRHRRENKREGPLDESTQASLMLRCTDTIPSFLSFLPGEERTPRSTPEPLPPRITVQRPLRSPSGSRARRRTPYEPRPKPRSET